MVMVCTEFVPWHGLDKVLSGLQHVPSGDYELHLAGRLSDSQMKEIANLPSVINHGPVKESELKALYTSCNVGLSCFAFERKGMQEGSTLKVREYLASGLP